MCWLPWVPEVFLACGGNFRCWPKADTSSAVGRSREKNAFLHYKDLTETGNRARKVSGTQGTWQQLFSSFKRVGRSYCQTNPKRLALRSQNSIDWLKMTYLRSLKLIVLQFKHGNQLLVQRSVEGRKHISEWSNATLGGSVQVAVGEIDLCLI